MKAKILTLLGVLGISFCGKVVVTKKGNAARGAALWAKTCQRCHRLRDPKDFTDNHWHITVQHMRFRANLSGRDARDILAFLKQSNDPEHPEATPAKE